MIATATITHLQKQIARNNDPLAYKELFVSFYHPLWLFAFSIVKSKQLAEEIVSDVFLHIWEKRQYVEHIANFKVYLYVATKNTALNYIVKQKRVATEWIEDLSMDPESIYLNPEQLLITSEMVSRIKEAVGNLPPKCQVVFKLVKENGLRYKEVAEILHLSVKTVESQMTIALRKIGEAIHFDIKKSIHPPHDRPGKNFSRL